jgi:hypothetical protein
MQQVGPVLTDPFLQIGDAAGQLGPLVLQSGNDMRFGHNPYPLEKIGLCSSCWGYLASCSWWRLLHKTGHFRPSRMKISLIRLRRIAMLWSDRYPGDDLATRVNYRSDCAIV